MCNYDVFLSNLRKKIWRHKTLPPWFGLTMISLMTWGGVEGCCLGKMENWMQVKLNDKNGVCMLMVQLAF